MEQLYKKVEDARRTLGADAALAVLREELLPACRGEVRAWQLFLEVCRERLGEKPGAEVQAWIAEGLISADRLIQQKAWEQALAVCVKLCVWDPWDARVLLRLAACGRACGDQEVGDFLEEQARDLETEVGPAEEEPTSGRRAASSPSLRAVDDGATSDSSSKEEAVSPTVGDTFLVEDDTSETLLDLDELDDDSSSASSGTGPGTSSTSGPAVDFSAEADTTSKEGTGSETMYAELVFDDDSSSAVVDRKTEDVDSQKTLEQREEEFSRINLLPCEVRQPEGTDLLGRPRRLWSALSSWFRRAPVDHLHFSITGPALIQRADSHLLQVWAHLGRQHDQVRRRAREAQPEGEVQMTTRGPHAVARGTAIDIVLRIPSLLSAPLRDTILWEGEITSASFLVHVAADARYGNHSGEVEFRVGGMRVTTLAFVVAVGNHTGGHYRLDREERRARSAFASYASEDRDAVLARVQGIQKVAPDLDIFLDVGRLRSGEKWKPRLEKEILGRDVLYLFWSLPASRSTWVDWEWRTAYGRRGLDFIDPVPLADPREVPPPTELSELHFGDWVLAYMRGRGTGSPPP